MAKLFYVAGIDIGSSYTKTVILNGDAVIESYNVIPSGAVFEKAAWDSMEDALAKARLERKDISYILSTGYGRHRVSFANQNITEINCHAFGAKKTFPECGMVIDVGGQDSKVILVGDRGMAIRFVMNDKCAAGTGRFLEVMARALEIGIEEMGAISLRSQNRVEVSSVCTVFAETEVITLLASGYDKADIVAAIFRAIARRLVGFINQIGIKEKIVMTGGVAKGIGLPTVLAEKLKTEILISEEPQINGAFGAAAIALDRILQRR